MRHAPSNSPSVLAKLGAPALGIFNASPSDCLPNLRRHCYAPILLHGLGLGHLLRASTILFFFSFSRCCHRPGETLTVFVLNDDPGRFEHIDHVWRETPGKKGLTWHRVSFTTFETSQLEELHTSNWGCWNNDGVYLRRWRRAPAFYIVRAFGYHQARREPQQAST